MKETLYIGRYSEYNGISVYDFNSTTGQLFKKDTPTTVINPSYLHINKNILYSAIETNEYNGLKGGAVAAFEIHPATGDLSLINTQNSMGDGSCHLICDMNRSTLFTANYVEGSISCFTLNVDGSINPISCHIYHHGKGPDEIRQEQAHMHFVTFTPDNKYLCAVDLGIDKIIAYELSKHNNEVFLKHAFETAVAPGTGPRHLVFSPNGKYAYLVGELSNTVTVLSYLGENGFEVIQTIKTIPENFKNDESHCAAIKISSGGEFIYVSNRGYDSIAIFKICSGTGRLTLVDQQPCFGKGPRDFSLDKTEKYLITANSESNNLAVFDRDLLTGKLKLNNITEDIENPVCVIFN